MSDDGIQLTLPDGVPLHLHRWLPQQPEGWAVLIVHGMGEHSGRYARFAAALNAAGASVYGVDLPGHGLTARRAGDRGHFADRDGWNYALTAIDTARSYAAAQHPRQPLYLFAHSMGSFLSQHYLVERGRGLAGVILSATNASMGAKRVLGLALMRAEALLLGVRHPSQLALEMSFRRYNARIRDAITDYDWLSRDAEEVQRRLADPLCGFACTAQLWADLLGAGADLTDPARLKRLPKRLPVLMVAGTDDPVSDFARGCESLAQAYRIAGLRDVTVWKYRGGRHELLNDTCRNEVTADILSWLHDHRVASRRRTAEETAA
jgi:alpha-beta hydrolase superfamily lysophospholipase